MFQWVYQNNYLSNTGYQKKSIANQEKKLKIKSRKVTKRTTARAISIADMQAGYFIVHRVNFVD